MLAASSIREVPGDPLAAARELGPHIAAAAAETERNRRVSAELLSALRDAGLFRMGLPEEVGGSATDLPTMLAVFEEVARHDGSAGWITAIAAGTSFLLTGLPPEVVRASFSPDPDIVTGGTFLTRGRAVRVDGGYRVSGRWPFASGCEHCTWLMGGCEVMEGDEPALDDDERPVRRIMVFRRDEATIHDTWDVAGLRGTGSHDVEVTNLFVPDTHGFLIGDDRGAFSFPHARMPLSGMLASMLAAVLLGMARGAIDALVDQVRTREIGSGFVKDQPAIRVRVAEAEALVQSARAFVFRTVERMWECAAEGDEVPARDDVLLRLASSHAAQACGEAVGLMFTAGGTAALYADSVLQRFQRDVIAARQHGMIAFYSYEGVGRDLLDAESVSGSTGPRTSSPTSPA